MKKIFPILLVIFLSVQSYAQLIQASVDVGSTPNRMKIFLKADQNQVAGPPSISSLTFNVGVDAVGLSTPPTMTIIKNIVTFPASASWTINTPYLEGGFWNYNIFLGGAVAPIATANIPYEVMEVEFNGFPLTKRIVGLVSLPDGGTNGQAYFFSSGPVLNSDGLSQLYYTNPPNPNVTTTNQNSYQAVAPFTPQTGTSTALLINPIPLPVKFTGFSVVKKDNGANLSWQVENETALTDRYEVERSLNGIDFKSITTIALKNNGRSANAYTFTDADILSIHSSAVVYYRIKQTDKDGQFIYTEIKSVRLDSKGFSASIFPNPVRSKASLSIDLIENSPVTITLNDANGKVLKNIQVQGLKGINKKEVDMSNLSSGNYLLRIQTSTETTTLNVVKGN